MPQKKRAKCALHHPQDGNHDFEPCAMTHFKKALFKRLPTFSSSRVLWRQTLAISKPRTLGKLRQKLLIRRLFEQKLIPLLVKALHFDLP